MPSKGNLKDDPNHPVVYQIRLKGHLDDRWADWFGGLTITLEENGDTRLTGPVPDQAALFGLLRRVRDLGLQLISVNCVDTGNQDRSTGILLTIGKTYRKGEDPMNAQNVIANSVDPEGKWMYRVAGICAIVLVVGYFLTFPLYGWVGNPPASGVEAQLAYFAEHAAGWWAIVFLMVFTDLLLVPIFFGIYMALKHINRGLMLVALAFKAFLFVILDLAVTWTAFSAMIIAGVQYGAATNEAQRVALAAVAAYPSAMLASPLAHVYANVIPALGVLFAGVVMLKGVFNKATAYLALAMGLTGILYLGSFFIDGLAVLAIIAALLAMFFYLLVGVRLYKLGKL